MIARHHHPRQLAPLPLPRDDLLVNVPVYASFPLISGAAVPVRGRRARPRAARRRASTSSSSRLFVDRARDRLRLRSPLTASTSRGRAFERPSAPSSSRSCRRSSPRRCSTLGDHASRYEQLGLPAVALFAIVLLIFQYLVGELLLSQDRADELEQRAKQLAGLPGGAPRRAPPHARPARPDDRAPLAPPSRATRASWPRAPDSRRRTRSWRTPPASSTTSASSSCPTKS